MVRIAGMFLNASYQMLQIIDEAGGPRRKGRKMLSSFIGSWGMWSEVRGG